MLKTAVILSLAMTAMAAVMHHSENIPEQIVRIGSVGTTFLNFNGVFEQESVPKADGIPLFYFKYIKDGVPVVEEEKVFFRCSSVKDFYVSHVDNPKPVLICRNEAFEKSNVADTSIPKRAFLLSAESFDLPNGVYDMYLSFGKSVWQQLVESQPKEFSNVSAAVPATVRALYTDDLKIFKSSHPFKTMLTYDIPTTRVKRQFGGGFSGSGAQAGAASFGGGGGIGGFPGGGFGGGFSGSQASAGAGSFGGGGGFFG